MQSIRKRITYYYTLIFFAVLPACHTSHEEVEEEVADVQEILPDITSFTTVLQRDSSCLFEIYSQVDRDYFWIGKENAARRALLDDLYSDPGLLGILPGSSFNNYMHSVRRAESLIEFSDSLLGNEISATKDWVNFCQLALYGLDQPQLNDNQSTFCRDTTLTQLVITTLNSDLLYSALLDNLPSGIGSRIRWLRQFYELANLDYSIEPITDFKEDSASCIRDVEKALRSYGSLQVVDSLLTYDTLLYSIREFQRQHGLKPDGVIGKRTRRSLEKSNRQRLGQLYANIDRQRKQADWEAAGANLEVNIPEMALRYIENGEVLSQHRVIIGEREEDRTPVFHARLNEIVLNPEWNVPYSIATEELLPSQQDDSLYLEDHNYVVYNRQKELLAAREIEWNRLDEDWFPYRIVQVSGPHNSLGRIKFLFPNRYQVYIHDTPGRHLFHRSERDFSHGCIRVENPFDLADHILKYTQSRLDSLEYAALKDTASNYSIPLHPAIPVWVTYNSVMKDESQGDLIFYWDIYGRDEEWIRRVEKTYKDGALL